MKGAVTYARVSTSEQANTNHSLPVQQKKFSDYCQRNNLETVAAFIDHDSARTDDRPQFKKMLTFCKANRPKISHLIVSDLSRLARNVVDQGNTVVLLAHLNIQLVSVDEQNLDESASGRL